MWPAGQVLAQAAAAYALEAKESGKTLRAVELGPLDGHGLPEEFCWYL